MYGQNSLAYHQRSYLELFYFLEDIFDSFLIEENVLLIVLKEGLVAILIL